MGWGEREKEGGGQEGEKEWKSMKERGKKPKAQGSKTLKPKNKPAKHTHGLRSYFQTFSSTLLFTVATCFNLHLIIPHVSNLLSNYIVGSKRKALWTLVELQLLQ